MLNKFYENTMAGSSAPKRQYRSPALVHYGQVRDLTQGGASGKTELLKNCNGNANRKCNPSDRNLKENIIRIGEHPLGIGLYLFDYKPGLRDQWGHGRQFGVMAQEVETVIPEAVCVHPDGYKMVDYGLLGISRADQ